MKRLNKKGFTLVELLAVIVVLAVVAVIGVSSVGPILDRAKRSSFATEGINLIEAAKTVYQIENKTAVSACYKLEDLKSEGYYTKGDSEKYYGSVQVIYTADGNAGSYSYKVWLANESFLIDGKTFEQLSDYDANVTFADADTNYKTNAAFNNCGVTPTP